MYNFTKDKHHRLSKRVKKKKYFIDQLEISDEHILTAKLS